METPVDEDGSQANGLAPRLRKRRLAILLTTAILGPPIGGLIALAWGGAWYAFKGSFVDFIRVLPTGPLVVVPFSYVIAWQFALATAVLNALLLPFVSGWKKRLPAALAVGLAVTYALAFRRHGGDFFSPATYLPSGGTLAVLGGLSSACCVWLVDNVSITPAKPKA